MLIPNKHSGYNRQGRRAHNKKNNNAPPMDPRYFDIMDKQVKQGDDLVQFVKDQWAANQPRLEAQDDLNTKVTNQQMDLAAKAGERADQQWDFYQSTGKPMLQKVAQDANDWDSASGIQHAQQEARTDQQMAFDNAQSQNNRMLTRMGVNPNSMKFAQLNNSLMMQKAASTAGAVTQAADQRKLQAVTMRDQAGNLLSGMPAQSMGFSGQAGGFGTAASGVGAGGINSNLAAQGAVASGLNAGAGIYGSAGNSYNNLYNTQIQGYGIQSKSNDSAMSGIGSLIGTGISMIPGFADGGQVDGPGTGTSDDVPAVNGDNGQPIRLSNGEYVVSADVVRAKGREFFDKLQQRYHSPVRGGNLRKVAA